MAVFSSVELVESGEKHAEFLLFKHYGVIFIYFLTGSIYFVPLLW